jgi:hypothetical protein
MPSSVIRAFDYRPAAREQEALFMTGRRDACRDLPPAVVSALAAARDRGRCFNDHIRDRCAASEKIGGVAPR